MPAMAPTTPPGDAVLLEIPNSRFPNGGVKIVPSVKGTGNFPEIPTNHIAIEVFEMLRKNT